VCGASGNTEVKKCVQSRFYTMQRFCWDSVGDLLVNLLRVKFARRPGILTVANTVWYAN
jgi:hypothetical protein